MIEVYSISNDVSGGVVNSDKLNDELELSGFIVGFNGITIKGDELCVHLDSFSDKPSADTLIQDHVAVSLLDYKHNRYVEIDNRTGELISVGYVYNSVRFSLSQNAQINISAVNQTRDELTYPISFSNIDDTETYSVVSSADMHGIYLTALGTKKTHLDSGSVLKDGIRDAVDEAAVDLIIDNR